MLDYCFNGVWGYGGSRMNTLAQVFFLPAKRLAQGHNKSKFLEKLKKNISFTSQKKYNKTNWQDFCFYLSGHQTAVTRSPLLLKETDPGCLPYARAEAASGYTSESI